MKQYTTKLRESIQDNINMLEIGESDVLKRISKIILLLENAFIELKSFIANYKFQVDEEIHFFLKIKPELFCKLIYYRKIYNIEMGFPVSCYSAQKVHFEKEQEHIKRFFDKNIEFIKYIGQVIQHWINTILLEGGMTWNSILKVFILKETHFSQQIMILK